MNDTPINRAALMFLRGGKDVLPAFEDVLGVGGWQKFPLPYQDTLRVMWQNCDLNVARWESELDDYGKDWILQLDKKLATAPRASYDDMQAVAALILESHIKEFATYRLGKLAESAANGSSSEVITRGLSELLADLQSQNADGDLLISAEQSAGRAIAVLDEWHAGESHKSVVKTGFAKIDKYALLKRKQILAIIAPTGVGKSSLGFQMASNIAKRLYAERRPGCVLVFSMEMDGDELWLRIASADTSIDQTAIMCGDIKKGERPEFRQKLFEYQSLPLVICERAGLSMSVLNGLVAQASRQYNGVEMALLDYGELAKPDDKFSNQNDRVDAIFKEFFQIIRNHKNPDGTRAAGIIIGRTLKNSSDSPFENQLRRAENIIRGGGQNHIGQMLVPFAPYQHIELRGDGWAGATDILRRLASAGIAPDDVTEADRLLWVPKNRHNMTGAIMGYRFRAEYTRWEEVAREDESA